MDALKKMPDVYACEPDAKRAAQQAERLSNRLHNVRVSICTEDVRMRGRPPKTGQAPTRTRYRLVWTARKDPLIVNDIFLKTPSRIDALGMVLIIALMVWRLMERSMRTYVKNTGTLLTGWAGRPTDKPTSFMMTTAMAGIMVSRVGNRRTLLCPPQERPMAYLKAMGLDANAFIDPGCQCTPIIPRNISEKG